MAWFNPIEVRDILLPVLDKDGKNKCDFYVADVIGNRRFAQNYGGHPRNDISLINEQSNMAVAKSMMESLVELPSTQNDGITDAELRLSLKSKYCQSPSEVLPYYERELQKVYERRIAENAQKVDKVPKEPIKSDVEQVIDNV